MVRSAELYIYVYIHISRAVWSLLPWSRGGRGVSDPAQLRHTPLKRRPPQAEGKQSLVPILTLNIVLEIFTVTKWQRFRYQRVCSGARIRQSSVRGGPLFFGQEESYADENRRGERVTLDLGRGRGSAVWSTLGGQSFLRILFLADFDFVVWRRCLRRGRQWHW